MMSSASGQFPRMSSYPHSPLLEQPYGSFRHFSKRNSAVQGCLEFSKFGPEFGGLNENLFVCDLGADIPCLLHDSLFQGPFERWSKRVFTQMPYFQVGRFALVMKWVPLPTCHLAVVHAVIMSAIERLLLKLICSLLMHG